MYLKYFVLAACGQGGLHDSSRQKGEGLVGTNIFHSVSHQDVLRWSVNIQHCTCRLRCADRLQRAQVVGGEPGGVAPQTARVLVPLDPVHSGHPWEKVVETGRKGVLKSLEVRPGASPPKSAWVRLQLDPEKWQFA